MLTKQQFNSIQRKSMILWEQTGSEDIDAALRRIWPDASFTVEDWIYYSDSCYVYVHITSPKNSYYIIVHSKEELDGRSTIRICRKQTQ